MEEKEIRKVEESLTKLGNDIVKGKAKLGSYSLGRYIIHVDLNGSLWDQEQMQFITAQVNKAMKRYKSMKTSSKKNREEYARLRKAGKCVKCKRKAGKYSRCLRCRRIENFNRRK